ncbi:MAG: class II aldolase/adducin family protein, partial [Alphaproteobacteria bacterium]
MDEAALRSQLAALGASLFARGYSVGTAGNISVRLPDGFLMTPTNSCLGRLDPARISKLAPDFSHVSGDKPSKEVFMHRAVLNARPDYRGQRDHLRRGGGGDHHAERDLHHHGGGR